MTPLAYHGMFELMCESQVRHGNNAGTTHQALQQQQPGKLS
jgi:hypothetical protein